MRFLETLQKRASERHFSDDEFTDEIQVDAAPVRVNEAAGMLSQSSLRIGAPKVELTPLGESPREQVRTEIQRVTVQRPAILEPAVRQTALVPAFRKITVDIAAVNPRVVSITHPHSAYCEEYRSLRTHIMHKSQKRKLQAIVVASVGPSEGKSITALNLSWLFAQTDRVRALVIDSDLRMPSLSGYLGVECGKGLSEVLVGQATLAETIVELEPAGLFLLPGGQARSDVAELISGPRFGEILDEARGMFDYVIIDAPPLGIFTDAALLINKADGALLVVKANQTRYKDIDRVLDTLPRERILGTVLNQSDEQLMDESYYGYGSYEARRTATP